MACFGLCREKHVSNETAFKFWQEHGIVCCFHPVLRVHEYTGKHVVGISGRTAGFVHQLTLHYSDGSSKTNGEADGEPVPIQEFDPAVDGHITGMQYDPSLPGGREDSSPGPAFLGVGYRFHLSGGKVITLAGTASHFVGGYTMPHRSPMIHGPKSPQKDGNAVSYGFVDFYWTTDSIWTNPGVDREGKMRHSQPRHFIWQQLPPQAGGAPPTVEIMEGRE